MKIRARASFEGEFSLPGDKSITHRALLLNGVAGGEAVITGASTGEDCSSTCACLRTLGARVQAEGDTVWVKGAQEFRSGVTLDCGNSGTTMRLLTGLIAGRGISATLVGDPSLSARPMKRMADPLLELGACVQTQNGFAPLSVYPSELTGVRVQTQVSSAQVKSAILLAGITASGTTTVEESIKSRDHTERMLAKMGAKIKVDGNAVSVQKSELTATDIRIPKDFSSAAYFMALGALKGKTLCRGVGVNPTRVGILKVFQRMGVRYTLLNEQSADGEETADILVDKSPLKAIEIGGELVPSLVDELPLIALLCAFAEGESVIYGAKELRAKETDRIKTTAEMINALGGDCIETADGFIIRGKKTLAGGIVDSFLDHRIAMTAAVGLIASEKGGEVLRPECCAISFPDFFDKLA